MPGDALLDLDGLKERVTSVLQTKTRLEALRGQVQDELSSKEREVQDLGSEIEVLSKVIELFRLLMDQLVEKQVKVVETVGTKALHTIFPDLDLSLESEVDPKYNKIAVDFYFRKGKPDHPASHKGRPLESFGGGPCSVVSLILRILAIKKLNLWPLLVLDESLMAVSEEYIYMTGKFVRTICEQLGFDVVLVTHRTEYLEHAHEGYQCTAILEEDGVSSHLSLNKV